MVKHYLVPHCFLQHFWFSTLAVTKKPKHFSPSLQLNRKCWESSCRALWIFWFSSYRPIACWAHIPIIVMHSRINSREDVGGGGGVKVMVAEQPKPPNRFGHVCNLIHSIPLLPPPPSFLVTVLLALPSPFSSSFTLSHPPSQSLTTSLVLTYLSPYSPCPSLSVSHD